MFTGIGNNVDQNGALDSLKLSTPAYYNHIMQGKTSFIPKKMKKQMSACALPSIRTTNKYVVMYYTYYVSSYLNDWYKVYSKNKSRELAFKKFRKKSSYFSQVWNNLKKFDYVGIGDWSNNSKVRKGKGPICELKNYLTQNGLNLIEINEFNTSQNCFQCVARESTNDFKGFCKQTMKPFIYLNKSAKQQPQKVETKNVLYCINKDCHRIGLSIFDLYYILLYFNIIFFLVVGHQIPTIMDRDLNASLNILYLLKLYLMNIKRPNIFLSEKRKNSSLDEISI